MKQLITGIHHITAIAGNAQKNLEFYSGILGLRLVKKTVNFDAPEVYHFYYGDEDGNPGSILTFFPYGDLVHGRPGKGMVNVIAFSVDTSGLNYWMERLARFNVNFKPPFSRFGEQVIVFEDHDGLHLELVFTDKDSRKGYSGGTVPEEFAIKGFFSAEIASTRNDLTVELLTNYMDHKLVASEGSRYRYAATDSPGNYIDLVIPEDETRALPGNGTVHHIAFNVPDAEAQEEIRIKMVRAMLNPTPVVDRNYFTSVYFREPGGVLFEIATAGPGFDIDEEKAHLGELLKLPPQYEMHRDALIEVLVPVGLKREKFV